MSEWIDVPVAEVAVGDEVRIDGFGVFRFQDQTSNVELSGKMEVLVVDVAARYVTIKDGHGESRFRRSSIVAVRRRKPEPCGHVIAPPVLCGRAKGHEGGHQNRISPLPEMKSYMPGCGAKERGWTCTDHDAGNHVARAIHAPTYVYYRWPIVPAEPQPKPGDWRHKDKQGGYCYSTGCLGGVEREVFRASSGWSSDTRTGQPWVVKGGDPIVVHVEAESQNACDALRKAAELAYRGSYASPNQLDDYKRIGLDVRPVDRRGKR